MGRVKNVVADGVKEIWLSSEDTGAYGIPSLTLFCIKCKHSLNCTKGFLFVRTHICSSCQNMCLCVYMYI